jgi:hypothetical protein
LPKIFVSHSKYDKEFCDRFDSACAHVGLARFRSEFENIEKPAWKTINREIRKSNALFLLVGKELVKRQGACNTVNSTSSDWVFTQNWISYEVGVASQLRRDVWVLSESSLINFPVPYLNNYAFSSINLTKSDDRGFFYSILRCYKDEGIFSLHRELQYSCTNPHCGASYNLWTPLENGAEIVCPTCLTIQSFPDGRFLERGVTFPAPIISKIKRIVRKP